MATAAAKHLVVGDLIDVDGETVNVVVAAPDAQRRGHVNVGYKNGTAPYRSVSVPEDTKFTLSSGNERTPILPMQPSAHLALHEQLDAILAAHSLTRSYVSWSPTAADYPTVLAAVVRWARDHGAKMEDHIHDAPDGTHVETTRVTADCKSIVILHRPIELHIDGGPR